MAQSPPNMVLFLTADLVFSSRASGAGQTLNVPVESLASPAAVVERSSAGGVKLVLIDLGLPGLELEPLVTELKALPTAPAIVAYAPHVHEAKLQAAVGAGCDQVLTRGQFNTRLAELLARAK